MSSDPGKLARFLVGVLIVLVTVLVMADLPAVASVDREVSVEEQAWIDEIDAYIAEMGYDWVAGPTSVSNLSPEERARRLGGEMPADIAAIFDTLQPPPEVRGMTFRSSFDWRDFDGVTPAKDQEDCGSCWAFGACSATEAHVRIYEGVLLDISEQQTIDCNDQGAGCDGGWADAAYAVHYNPGAVSEDDIPYLATDGNSCRQKRHDKVAIIDGSGNVSNTVTSLKYAIETYGPLSVGMCVYEDFYGYTGGCYEHAGTDWTNHVVLMLGWDDEMCGGDGAWICKNSWGGGFGEGGFFYIKYGTCRIGSGAMRPVNAHIPKTILVPDQYASIQTAIDNSNRGDVIKVAEGTYVENIVIGDYRSLIGGYDATFTYRDPGTHPVIIDAGGLGHGIYVENEEKIVIDGVMVTNSGSGYAGIYLKDTEAIVRDVDVYGCWRGLVATYGGGGTDGALYIEMSSFHDNTGAGVFINDPPNADISLAYVASYDNGAAGIYSYSTDVEIVNCTLTGNGLEGGIDLRVSTDNVIKNNIIASNTGYGITCTSATPDLSYNDVWDNSSGDYNGCSAGVGDSSVDPVFCDAGAGFYAVHATSPTVTGGEGGTAQGALGIGCPEGPEDLLLAQDGASILISWSPPPWRRATVDYYVVYRDTTGLPGTQIATVAAPDTSFVDITIPACELNYYRVSAVDDGGLEGAPSNRVFGSICYDAPSDLDVQFVEGANEMSWRAADGPLDYYVVNRGNVTADPESLAWVSGADTSFVDIWTSACPRDNFSYEIVPVYDTGWHGRSSNEASVDPAPSPPSGIVVEWVGNDIVLTWDENCESDLAHYRVYRDSMPFSDPLDSELRVGLTPDLTYTDEDMLPHTMWFYRLAASDASSQKSVYSEMLWLGTGQKLEVPSPYATIQAAIDAAAAIDTVWVSPGTYDENITLKNAVLVMSSDGAATTTIRSSTGPVVSAIGLGDLSLLEGFTIDGQGTAANGLAATSGVMRVTDCVFQNCSNGANFDFGALLTMTGNTFTLCSNGVTVADSAAPFFSGCTFSNNTFTGVYSNSDPGPEVGRTLADANDFENNTYFQVFNLNAATVDADYNYWGDVCVEADWFYGPVDYIPWTDAAHENTYTECPNSVPDDEVPERAFSSYNFPNPFNPTTAIRYAIPAPGGRVVLSIYDLSGRRVKILINADVAPGTYTTTWRGLDDTGRQLGSGVYFYKLDAPGFSEQRKMVMLK